MFGGLLSRERAFGVSAPSAPSSGGGGAGRSVAPPSPAAFSGAASFGGLGARRAAGVSTAAEAPAAVFRGTASFGALSSAVSRQGAQAATLAVASQAVVDHEAEQASELLAGGGDESANDEGGTEAESDGRESANEREGLSGSSRATSVAHSHGDGLSPAAPLQERSRHVLWADADMRSQSEADSESLANVSEADGADLTAALLPEGADEGGGGGKPPRASKRRSRGARRGRRRPASQLEELVNAHEAGLPSSGALVARGVLYGLVNSVLLCPTVVSFASVVFRNSAYADFMPLLVRLMFFAGVVHQGVITSRSSMSFAVGQVQDVGLVVLSAIASGVAREATVMAGGVEHMTDQDKRAMTATALIFLAIATAMVGLLLYLVARCGVASIAQCCPLPVVGGYLGFVGFFCVTSGLTLAAGGDRDLSSLAEWARLVDEPGRIGRLGLCVGAALLYMLSNRLPAWLSSSLAMPALLLLVPTVFYMVVLGSGHTLAEARASHWVSDAPEGSAPFWDVWGTLYGVSSLGDVHWGLFPRLVLSKVLVLFFLVAFGSSLDVAAIQSEFDGVLDYNKELQLIGVSNVLTGLGGAGFTGSYIFSMTLFNLRSGVGNRVCGIVIMLGGLAFFLIPFSMVNYLPSFFLGSLLVFFGLEIIIDWLVFSVRRIGVQDYLMLLVTFAATVLTNVEVGVGIGLALAAGQFIYQYGRASQPEVEDISEDIEARHRGDRSACTLVGHMVRVLRLDGYLFFGAALSAANAALTASQEMGPGGFLLLDMTSVIGMDATSAHSLSQLAHNIERGGGTLIVCGSPRRGARWLLKTMRRHNLIPPGDLTGVRQALDIAEAAVLQRAHKVGAYTPPPQIVTTVSGASDARLPAATVDRSAR
eukprot:PRCOL_00006558-RA